MHGCSDIADFASGHEPVFVCGMPRGGTSMTYRRIAMAPAFGAVKGTQETHLLYEPESILGDAPAQMAINYLGGRENLDRFRDWFAGLDGWPDAWGRDRRIISAFFFFSALMAHKTPRRVIEKTPRHLHKIDRIFEFFPRARVIVLLRNPLAVVESYRTRLAREKALGKPEASYAWLDIQPREICGNAKRDVEAAFAAAERHGAQVMILNYDEVLRDPELFFHAIGRFIGCALPPISTTDRPPPETGGVVDPLLLEADIYRNNAKPVTLGLAERYALMVEFEDVFSRLSGLKLR